MESNNNRRNFLKSVGTLSLGAAIISPLSALPNTKQTEETDLTKEVDTSKPQTISILQTTDVHCQIHPHDELFWENGKAVFRKTGGYAYVATLLKELKKKNPNTYTIDTGDMFQGSELSVETTGAAFVPILNALDYDLYLPGNWEVIYGKKRMQTLLGSLVAPKICTNMYHHLACSGRKNRFFRIHGSLGSHKTKSKLQ
jgi:sulfur-oxidizing protein SoxB